MTNEIQVIDHTQASQLGQFNPSREQLDLLKRTIAKDTTDDEFSLFVNTAKRMGLDPFARQIHAVKRWDSKAKCEVMAIQVGIDGYRTIADRTGVYAPGPATEFEVNAKGEIVSATAFVKKLVAGEWHTISAAAHYDEYVQRTKEGVPTSMWKTKPRIMLGKCAEAIALRRAFPSQLAGVYTDDEMPTADAVEAQKPAKVIEETRQAPDVPPPVEKALSLISKALDLNQIDVIRERAAGYYGVGSDDYKAVEAACYKRQEWLTRP